LGRWIVCSARPKNCFIFWDYGFGYIAQGAFITMAEGISETLRTKTLSADLATEASSPDFVDALRALAGASGTSPLLAGRISVIGLDRVRKRFGRRWLHVAERVHRATRRAIGRHLSPRDLFTLWRETSYILLFANLTPEQATATCRLIADELGKALLGEEGAEWLEIKTTVANLAGGLEFTDLPSVDQLIHEAKRQPAQPKPNQVTLEWAEAEKKQEAPLKQQFAFRPMWDPARNVLSMYLCIPASTMGKPQQIWDETASRTLDDLLRFDLAMAERVLVELDAMHSDGRQLLITLPVHFESLSTAGHRGHYVQMLATRLTPAIGQFLVIELVGLPDGIVTSRLLEMVTTLMKCSRAVVARLRVDENNVSSFQTAGLRAVGCDLSGHSLSESALLQHMNRFNRNAARAKLRTYVRGVRTISLAAAAVGAGFSFIDGDIIASAVKRPECAVEFGLQDMYEPVARRIMTGTPAPLDRSQPLRIFGET